jgi:hypothetical protein
MESIIMIDHAHSATSRVTSSAIHNAFYNVRHKAFPIDIFNADYSMSYYPIRNAIQRAAGPDNVAAAVAEAAQATPRNNTP